MKKLTLILVSAFALALSAQAQDTFYPGWNLGVQGGANYVSSNEWQIGKFQHITPNGAISLGYDFAPWFGLRASLSGPMGTYPIAHKTIGKLNYGQLSLDAMFDVCNMFRYKESRFLSPYFFLGGGANYRFPVEQVKSYLGPVVRAGLGLNFRLAEGVHLGLELQDNGLNNQFNTLDDNEIYGGNILWIKRPFKWDDNFAALLGLKFDLGANAKRHAALAAAEAAAAEAAAQAAAAKAAAEAARAKARAVVENVYFELNKSILRDSELPKVEHIIAVLNQYPEAVVSLTGYADKETGTPKRNWTLSQERAERVAKALTDAGIAADRISTSFYGDTIQVSEVPEENRVCVCVTR